jgi:hypothetical protein
MNYKKVIEAEQDQARRAYECILERLSSFSEYAGILSELPEPDFCIIFLKDFRIIYSCSDPKQANCVRSVCQQALAKKGYFVFPKREVEWDGSVLYTMRVKIGNLNFIVTIRNAALAPNCRVEEVEEIVKRKTIICN